MTSTDEYGRLTISETNTSTRRAWAYIELREIDPELIFETLQSASAYARLHLDNDPQIIPVFVTGLEIERA